MAAGSAKKKKGEAPNSGSRTAKQSTANGSNDQTQKALSRSIILVMVAISVAAVGVFLARGGEGPGDNMTTTATTTTTPKDYSSAEHFNSTATLLKAVYQEISALGHNSDRELGAQGTYGEITYEGVDKMLGFLRLEAGDTFYDLGSGTGKVVMQAVLGSRASLGVGVELSENRHKLAEMALGRLQTEPRFAEGARQLDGKEVRFANGDATKVDPSDGTVIFMCSLCFPKEVMVVLTGRLPELLKPGTVIVTIRPFEGCHSGLVRLGHVNLEQSWTDTIAFIIYAVAPRIDWPALGQPLGLFALRGGQDVEEAQAAASSALAAKLTQGSAVFEALPSTVSARLTDLLVAAEAAGDERKYNEMGSWRLNSRELTGNWTLQAVGPARGLADSPARWRERWATADLLGNAPSTSECFFMDNTPPLALKLPKSEEKANGAEGRLASFEPGMLAEALLESIGATVLDASDTVWCECYDAGRAAVEMYWMGAAAVENSDVSPSRHETSLKLFANLAAHGSVSPRSNRLQGGAVDAARPLTAQLRPGLISSSTDVSDLIGLVGGQAPSIVVSSSVQIADASLMLIGRACASLPMGSVCVLPRRFPNSSPSRLLPLRTPTGASSLIAYMVAPLVDWPAYATRADWVGVLQPRWEMNITASNARFKHFWKEVLRMGTKQPSIQTAVAASGSAKEATYQVMDAADVRAILDQISWSNLPSAHREPVVMERVIHALPRTTLSGVQDGMASITQLWRLIEAGAMGNSAMSPLQAALRDGFFDDFRHKLVKEAGPQSMLTDEPIATVSSLMRIGPEDLVLDLAACKGRIATHLGLLTGAEVVGVTPHTEYARLAVSRMEKTGSAPPRPISFHATLTEALAALGDRSPTIIVGIAGDEAGGTAPSGDAWRLAISKAAPGGRLAAVRRHPWKLEVGEDGGDPDNLIETTLNLKLAWGQDGRGDQNAEVYVYAPEA